MIPGRLLSVTTELHCHLLTTVDRLTRWVEVLPSQDISTSTCVQAFYLSWIALFSVPVLAMSHHEKQFMSSL